MFGRWGSDRLEAAMPRSERRTAVFGPDYWLLPEASASEMAAAVRVSRPLVAAHLHLRIAGRRATTAAIWLAHIALNGLAAPKDQP